MVAWECTYRHFRTRELIFKKLLTLDLVLCTSYTCFRLELGYEISKEGLQLRKEGARDITRVGKGGEEDVRY